MMLCAVWKRVVPFAIAIVVGMGTVYLLLPYQPLPTVPKEIRGTGTGSGSGSGSGSGESYKLPDSGVGVRIISKPQARYTDAARVNNTEGIVRLKVTLMANGEVGSIQPVSALPDGLTEQAIAAARAIKFEPKKIDGTAVSTTVTVDYSFSIY